MNTKSRLTMRDAVLSFYESLSSTSWFKSGQVWVEFSDISKFPYFARRLKKQIPETISFPWRSPTVH